MFLTVELSTDQNNMENKKWIICPKCGFDELAEHAKEEKTLTTGTKVKHIAVFLPRSIDKKRGVFVSQHTQAEHKIEDFDWEGDRYCI